MANGYVNSSYGNQKTQEKEFVKERGGIKAPAGFHYMPNGKLMSDADHIAMHGYVEKTIRNFLMPLNDIAHSGETRTFTINADNGAFFSIEVYDSSNNYYNFHTQSWSTTKSALKNVKIGASYRNSIKFPAETSGLKNYTINVFAETVFNVKTKFSSYNEVRNPDNSINLNKSTGSNSNILTKILYQDVAKTLKISCIAPSKYAASTDTLNGATSSSSRAIFDNVVSTYADIGDLITGTGASTSDWVLLREINPDGDNNKEISIGQRADSFTDGATYTFTPVFNGVTPHSTDSSTGSHSLTVSSGSNVTLPFSITVSAPTGRALSVLRKPKTSDLCVFKNVTFESAALAIEDENTASSSKFYRWPVTNIAGLTEGMVLDPARSGSGANTTTPAFLSSYNTSTPSTRIISSSYSSTVVDTTIPSVSVPAVDPAGNDITTIDRNGYATAQKGNITFDTQQLDALKSDSNVRIFGYGTEQISAITGGMNVKLKNVEFELTQTTATLTAACNNSTTIAVDSLDGITWGSTVRGPGISATAVNPKVVTKEAQTGGGNIRVSVAQTIDDNQVLYFDGTYASVRIDGTIEVQNMAISDTSIYFDIERFLHCV